MGEKVATNVILEKLIKRLEDTNYVRNGYAGDTLYKLGLSKATEEIMNRLVYVLNHKNNQVKRGAFVVLRNIGGRKLSITE